MAEEFVTIEIYSLTEGDRTLTVKDKRYEWDVVTYYLSDDGEWVSECPDKVKDLEELCVDKYTSILLPELDKFDEEGEYDGDAFGGDIEFEIISVDDVVVEYDD